ncbi:MAG: hypothetical protein HY319_21095 [Armatimonadetes bacterium]|nr:hypothetical protein [Armatimonadota bacterium]
MSRVYRMVQQLQTLPVEGGAVEIPVDHLHRVYLLMWLADDGADPAVALSPPPEGVDWERIEAEVEPEGDLLHVGFPETGARWEGLRNADDLAVLLGSLPDGTRLELLTGSSEAHGCGRFEGAVQAGRWRIASTYPAMPRSTLESALELSRQVYEEDHLVADSEPEAEEAVAAANQEWSGIFQFSRDGLRMMAQGGADRNQLALLAAAVLRRRYADIWKVPEEDEDDTDPFASMASAISQAAQRIARSQAPPMELGERVLEGKAATFSTARMLDLAHVIPEDLEILDQEMARLGLRPLGELTTNKTPGTVFRGYGGDGTPWYGAAQAQARGSFHVDFYTRFGKGASLTTSTAPGHADLEQQKVFRRNHPDLELEQVLEEHRREIERLRGAQANPVPAEPDLESLARAMDEFMARVGL